jgi:hypothetical protein
MGAPDWKCRRLWNDSEPYRQLAIRLLSRVAPPDSRYSCIHRPRRYTQWLSGPYNGGGSAHRFGLGCGGDQRDGPGIGPSHRYGCGPHEHVCPVLRGHRHAYCHQPGAGTGDSGAARNRACCCCVTKPQSPPATTSGKATAHLALGRHRWIRPQQMVRSAVKLLSGHVTVRALLLLISASVGREAILEFNADDLTPVPEPTSVGLLGLALLTACASKRLRTKRTTTRPNNPG